MSEVIAALITSIDTIRSHLKATQSLQIRSKPTKENIRNLGTRFFSDLKPVLVRREGLEVYIDQAEKICAELIEGSRKAPSKSKFSRLLKDLKTLLAKIEGLMLQGGSSTGHPQISSTDTLIIESLKQICPPASLSYQQAIEDLRDERLSYRGPATDLWEALRETLDIMAPDKDIQASAGFKLEPDAKRPTMKQKVRFILRNRSLNINQIQPSETAVSGVEEIIGGLVRSVYNRSSVSTHSATDQKEVTRLYAWVKIAFCEILELPQSP